mmetsp:Transcript_117145/g.250313  ORF Transcript_117145/g.250313 Transcript_117145/m.250313 type:complete len:230 (+) Transcript_117145:37-726(+)
MEGARSVSAPALPELLARPFASACADFQSEGRKGFYEVKSGMVKIHLEPSKQSAGLGALKAGIRFFATPEQVGRTRWLRLNMPLDIAPAWSPDGTSAAGKNGGFKSDDVALNIYNQGAPLPTFSGAPHHGIANTFWILDDEQYVKRLRGVGLQAGGQGEGIPEGWRSSELRWAQRELSSPKRQMSSQRHWWNSGLKPHRNFGSTTSVCCDVNMQRWRTVDARLSLNYPR